MDNPTRQPVEAVTRELVDKLLLERLSLAGITRVTGVSPDGFKPTSIKSWKLCQRIYRCPRKKGKRQLWKSLPGADRQCAVCHTDSWDVYSCVLPSKRHCPGGKEQGQTNHIERLNNTLRQRMSRLVRCALSCSKKVENHAGA